MEILDRLFPKRAAFRKRVEARAAEKLAKIKDRGVGGEYDIDEAMWHASREILRDEFLAKHLPKEPGNGQ